MAKINNVSCAFIKEIDETHYPVIFEDSNLQTNLNEQEV